MDRLLSPLIVRSLAGCRTYVAAAVGFSLFLNLLTLALPLYTVQLYDRVLVSGSGATLTVLTIAVLGALLAAAVLEDVRSRLFVGLGCRFDRNLARPLLERQVEASVRSGLPMSGQALRDLDNVRQVLTGSGAIALLDLPWTPVFILVCFLLHPVLGGIAAIGAVVLLALATLNQWLVSRPLGDSAEQGEASYVLTETILRNAEIVQAMGMLPDLAREWSGLRGGLLYRQAVASFRNAGVSSGIKLFRNVLQVALFATGAWLVVEGSLTAGALFAASLLTTRALMPIDQIVGVWRPLVGARAGLRRLESAFAAPERKDSLALPAPTGRLSVENLTYVPAGAKAPVLRDVSFAVEPGQTVGIVGPSAAGKSTLARLIVGAVRPTNGTVRLDGADTYAWNRAEFGLAVGYVPQDIELFDGTIRDNIARFREADPLAIVKAAQLVGVHEMILRLPDGYETRIGATGAALSGGQRQRLALARAVFGDPKLVVMDEPNANLDGDGENALRELIARLKAAGATVLMIAHRPSVLVSLDRVLVLNNGTVMGYGPVAEILPQIAPGFPPQLRPVAQPA